MAKGLSSQADRRAFLAEARIGSLIYTRADGTPLGVPVWFDWTGKEVKILSGKESPKVNRFREDRRASLLVANRVGEPEGWMAFDGEIEISQTGGIELAEKLAPRYWDMTDQARIDELASWREAADAFCLLTLKPTRIRSGS